jgi:cytochrome c
MRATLSLLIVSGTMLVLAPASHAQAPADGQRLFQMRCGSCHVADKPQNRMGPSLMGVVGRPAGTAEGFKYSKAMTDSGIVWTREALDEFLTKPQAKVPGTSMAIAVPKPEDRAAIIDHLAAQATAPAQ